MGWRVGLGVRRGQGDGRAMAALGWAMMEGEAVPQVLTPVRDASPAGQHPSPAGQHPSPAGQRPSPAGQTRTDIIRVRPDSIRVARDRVRPPAGAPRPWCIGIGSARQEPAQHAASSPARLGCFCRDSDAVGRDSEGGLGREEA